jgi:hypothetical protein
MQQTKLPIQNNGASLSAGLGLLIAAFSETFVGHAAFAVEGQVKLKSRSCQLLKDLSEKFKEIQPEALVCFLTTQEPPRPPPLRQISPRCSRL